MAEPLHTIVADVTQQIKARSQASRESYLAMLAEYPEGPARSQLSCANLAHVMAAEPAQNKARLAQSGPLNIGIVTAYNDMLSAHQPFALYPSIIKEAAFEMGATAQVAGGVPAMCDGVTQGQAGMELSLFSREVIAMATAVALSHGVYDASLLLGVCDKIIPGLIMGALQFGHLAAIPVPAGPMSSGIANKEKALARQAFARGEIDREALLAVESKSYHSAGTCTFYGTANSNQMLMEVMGLHLPGTAFIQPDQPLRHHLTQAAAQQALSNSARGSHYRPLGQLVNEKSLVNGIVGLLATGGSTNHVLHIPAIARAAGFHINLDDIAALSAVVPLLARVYPNGQADVNQFHAAGGIGFVIRQLLSGGLLHADVQTNVGDQLWDYTREPYLDGNGKLDWRDGPEASLDESILRPLQNPFENEGGLRLLTGQLGRAVMKISAVAEEHRRVQAPARVFDSQEAFLTAFQQGELTGDFVAVVRFQGPAANGMPELHKLTPALGVMQDRGQKVALVTDGRMSGASGKVPAAIHLCPEAAHEGFIAKLRDGDLMEVDAQQGRLWVDVDEAELAARPAASMPQAGRTYGRGLFDIFRRAVTTAEEGASSCL